MRKALKIIGYSLLVLLVAAIALVYVFFVRKPAIPDVAVMDVTAWSAFARHG